ncbi:MAG TPA: carboxyl transferase domain-containing protein, partial [Candidatus Binataceae bacterium]|nr:carboxyl transferase domain-containing protein [Candidatus Binataceae bacterium]
MARYQSRIDTHSATFAENREHFEKLLKELRERQALAAQGGGEAMTRRHRERGKIPVRERIEMLLDPMSPFLELSPLAAWGLYKNEVPAAGIITGVGVIKGVACMIIANDATVKGGSFFAETVKKHVRAQDVAWENRLPC